MYKIGAGSMRLAQRVTTYLHDYLEPETEQSAPASLAVIISNTAVRKELHIIYKYIQDDTE
jgi:hypothetical protein